MPIIILIISIACALILWSLFLTIPDIVVNKKVKNRLRQEEIEQASYDLVIKYYNHEISAKEYLTVTRRPDFEIDPEAEELALQDIEEEIFIAIANIERKKGRLYALEYEPMPEVARTVLLICNNDDSMKVTKYNWYACFRDHIVGKYGMEHFSKELKFYCGLAKKMERDLTVLDVDSYLSEK